jgi:hypothetical protein
MDVRCKGISAIKSMFGTTSLLNVKPMVSNFYLIKGTKSVTTIILI